jgi:hypothetical protein
MHARPRLDPVPGGAILFIRRPTRFVPPSLVLVVLLAATVLLPSSSAVADAGVPRSERPTDAALYFISPEGGARLTSPVTVRFGLRGMGVAPAGIKQAATGHHHLILDADLPPLDLPVPKDEHHLHFGGGQTEVTLDLKPGSHTLQLLLADQNHVPHDPPVVSERITITVEPRSDD